MSLVIMAWDKSVGIAVCEGRALARIDGKLVTVSEDYYKLARLPNGGILGFAGRPRDGYVSNSLWDLIENHLLPDVALAARSMGFLELSSFIPEKLKEYTALFPENLLFVSLLAAENGMIRGGAWDSNGGTSGPTGSTHWHVLGPEKLAGEADILVYSSLRAIGGLRNPSRAGDVLQSVIRSLAATSEDINDHTRIDYVYSEANTLVTARAGAAAPKYAALSADVIKTGTLDASLVDVVNVDASNISTGTLSAEKVLFADGTALTSASRVLTSKATLTTASSLPTGQWTPVNGLAWTAQTESSSDVYNVQGDGSISIGGSAGMGMVRFGVFVDGNTGTNYGSGFIYVSMPTSAQVSASGTFFGNITGLTPGTHTIQVYAWNNTTQSATINDGYAICQRIF